VLLLVAYFVANLLLAIAAFWVAMEKPQYGKLLWWIVVAFVLGAAWFIWHLIHDNALQRILLHY